MKSAPSPFELWAHDHGYDIAPAVVPSDIRQYADRDTQAVFDAFNEGAQSVARMLTDSSIETDALRERIKRLAE